MYQLSFTNNFYLNSLCALLLSHVWLFVIQRTEAYQAPMCIGILQTIILEWVTMPSYK